jgi:predicted ABC-type ATPase
MKPVPMRSLLDRRPIVVALAGPNGAGKTTFYYSNLQLAGLRLVNADVLTRELRMDPYQAARIAGSIRPRERHDDRAPIEQRAHRNGFHAL